MNDTPCFLFYYAEPSPPRRPLWRRALRTLLGDIAITLTLGTILLVAGELILAVGGAR